MVMKMWRLRFVDISNPNTEAKMFSFFIGKPKFDPVLYNIELKLDAQQKQIDELRALVLQLSKEINTLTIELNYLSNERYGKSI